MYVTVVCQMKYIQNWGHDPRVYEKVSIACRSKHDAGGARSNEFLRVLHCPCSMSDSYIGFHGNIGRSIGDCMDRSGHRSGLYLTGLQSKLLSCGSRQGCFLNPFRFRRIISVRVFQI